MSEIEAIKGKGVKAKIDDQLLIEGNPRLLEEKDIELDGDLHAFFDKAVKRVIRFCS